MRVQIAWMLAVGLLLFASGLGCSPADTQALANQNPQNVADRPEAPALPPPAEATPAQDNQTTGPDTYTLELKRLDRPSRSPIVGPSLPLDYLYGMTYYQRIYVRVYSGRTDDQAEAFRQAVKKEPAKYFSERPFRGVAKLGSQEYGFALDSKDEEAKGYGRLYFDLNHNGDLTDDKVIEAQEPPRSYSSGSSRAEFPRVDLTVDADGTKVDYAFTLSAYSSGREDYWYAYAMLKSAAYREGRITLDGKPRHVVLLDFNGNGRFDDEFTIREGASYSDGRVVTQYGDMLLVDPSPNVQDYRSTYDVTTAGSRQYVSKLASIGGRFYEMKVSAAGDKLTLKPCSAPVGYVTNPNDGFRAVVYSDRGFVNIGGGKSDRIPLPEGDWKLLSYTIDQTGYEEPKSEPAEEKKPEERSLMQRLADALTGGSASSSARPSSASSSPRYTVVSAQATRDYKAVKVRKGQTVLFPFGPPYKPVVKTSSSVRAGQSVSLGLSIVGAGDEICSNLMVNGNRPDAPEFTITAPDGEEVDVGKFKYG